MTDRADRDERPPTTAQGRLEGTVADEVQRLAVAMDLAFLEADRLLSEDDAEAAAAALERQRAELADAGGRLREAVSAAMVERSAEEVVADAAERIDGATERSDGARPVVVSQSTDDSNVPLRERLLARAPAVAAAAAAVVVGLVTMYGGPQGAPLDPAATEGQLDGQSAPSPGAPGVEATEPTDVTDTPAAFPPDALVGPTFADGGLAVPPTVSPEIVDLVDRILAQTTSTDLEVVAQSPLLDDVDGEELQAALDLLEERLAEVAEEPTDSETTLPDDPLSDTPTEVPTDPDVLDGTQP